MQPKSVYLRAVVSLAFLFSYYLFWHRLVRGIVHKYLHQYLLNDLLQHSKMWTIKSQSIVGTTLMHASESATSLEWSIKMGWGSFVAFAAAWMLFYDLNFKGVLYWWLLNAAFVGISILLLVWGLNGSLVAYYAYKILNDYLITGLSISLLFLYSYHRSANKFN